MKNPIKIHLFGSEKNGWALDADLATTRQSLLQLPELVQLTSLAQSDIVYSVWEYPLLYMDPQKLKGKRIVCQVCNDLMRIHEDPCMIRARSTIGLWIPMTRECVTDIQSLGYDHFFIPYAVDTSIFTPDLPEPASVGQLRLQFNVPEDSFLISNFMRDSSAQDLFAPKEQKGTELLLEIARQLVNRDIPVHFLLAGPRRHWIRQQMDLHGIPYTFVGEKIAGDDAESNILSADIINRLYHISDLHLVTSRWEGGPRAVLECAATRTPLLSTPVGVASDILHEDSLFSSVDQGIRAIAQHYNEKSLQTNLDAHYQTLLTHHTPTANVKRFTELIEKIDEIPVYMPSTDPSVTSQYQRTIGTRIIERVGKLLGTQKKDKPLCISLWHEFHKPPYGGGNQFMMALRGALKRHGVKVVENKINSGVDIHICNSAWFDRALFEKKAAESPLRMIHRIDGPTTLYRGEGRDEDDHIFSLNKQFASATVFQSSYSFKKSYELGYHAVSPTIIHNSVNESIFHAQAREPFHGERKVRLISSAWSDNPRKGGALLKWLDDHLDWDQFEYTFVGRVQEKFHNIKHIPPQDSEALAGLLRSHDIFVSVSQNEPCSNALLEALCCGMPALFRNDGGNGELVSFAGLPFNDEGDILGQLQRLVQDYESFQRLIRVNTIDVIAQKYIALAWKVIDWNHV